MKNYTTYKPDDTDILRQISIAYYLDNQGFKPVKRHRTGKELLYLSPMRNESKPATSFLSCGNSGMWTSTRRRRSCVTRSIKKCSTAP